MVDNDYFKALTVFSARLHLTADERLRILSLAIRCLGQLRGFKGIVTVWGLLGGSLRHYTNGNAGEIEMKGEDVAECKAVREGESRSGVWQKEEVEGEAEDRRTVTTR